jgi:hypothetical protein
MDAATYKRVHGEPGSLLKLRLERIKQIANLRDEVFANFLDGEPHSHGKSLSCEWNKYVDGSDEFHLHFDAIRPFCATFRADVMGQNRGFALTHDFDDMGLPVASEHPVFVWIRNLSQSFSPCASFVRLQFLDHCDMREAHAFEPGRYVPRKFLWRIVNRKLGILLGRARIELSEFEDEIIQGGAQVITDLAKYDADNRSRTWEDVGVSLIGAIRRIRLEVELNRLNIILPETVGAPLQISKMFLCPIDPLRSAIEWVARMNHAKIAI